MGEYEPVLAQPKLTCRIRSTLMERSSVMSDASPSDESIRYRWLKAMYAANIVISAPLGLGALLAPETFRMLMEVPPQDPVYFGMASGAVPLGFGLAGLWGLRAPITASPILLLQAAYKTLFLLAVALPLAVTGTFPGYAVPIVAIFVFFIVGNLIAVPFRALFGSSPVFETWPEGAGER